MNKFRVNNPREGKFSFSEEELKKMREKGKNPEEAQERLKMTQEEKETKPYDPEEQELSALKEETKIYVESIKDEVGLFERQVGPGMESLDSHYERIKGIIEKRIQMLEGRGAGDEEVKELLNKLVAQEERLDADYDGKKRQVAA